MADINPTEPTTSDQFPDIQAFLRTLASYPDEVVAAAAVQAADEIQRLTAERDAHQREYGGYDDLIRRAAQLIGTPEDNLARAQSAEASLARMTEERDGAVKALAAVLGWFGGADPEDHEGNAVLDHAIRIVECNNA